MKTVLVPYAAACGFYSSPVQITGDVRIIVAARKHLKHLLYYGRGFLVYNVILFAVYLIAERDRSAEIFTFLVTVAGERVLLSARGAP